MKRVAIALAVIVSCIAGMAESALADPNGQTPSSDMVWHFSTSVIWVQDDTTSGLWPVKQAVAAWDLGTNLQAKVGPCQPNAGCVLVSEGPEDPTTAGATWATSQNVDHTFTGPNHTEFNLTWGQLASAHDRAQVTCHELGHAFGLMYHWYDETAGSCLYWAADEGAATTPNAQDKAFLNAVYTAPPVVVNLTPTWRYRLKRPHWFNTLPLALRYGHVARVSLADIARLNPKIAANYGGPSYAGIVAMRPVPAGTQLVLPSNHNSKE